MADPAVHHLAIESWTLYSVGLLVIVARLYAYPETFNRGAHVLRRPLGDVAHNDAALPRSYILARGENCMWIIG